MFTIKELKEKPWQEVKAIASALGIEKPDRLEWKDERILEKIMEAERLSVDKTKSTSKESKPNYFRELILYCGVCDRPLTTDTKGKPTCHG